jgi:hypothetical protein
VLVGAMLGVLVTLAVGAVLLVLGGGRDEKRHVSARPVPSGPVIYTLRRGDVVRDPLTATRCEASGEGGSPNLFCTRTSRGRYQFVFYKDAVLVFDLLDPNAQPLEPKYDFKWIARRPIRVHAK